MFIPNLIASIALAQTNQDSLPPEAYQRISSLTLFVAILGILVIMVLSTILVLRRSQRRKQAMPKPEPTEHTDAWAESGRRFDNSIVEIDPNDD